VNITEYLDYALDRFQNLINSFLVHNIPIPKIHKNPPIAFRVILLTNRLVKTVPRPNVVE